MGFLGSIARLVGKTLLLIGLSPLILFLLILIPWSLWQVHVFNPEQDYVQLLGSVSDSTAKIWLRSTLSTQYWVEYTVVKDNCEGYKPTHCDGWCKTNGYTLHSNIEVATLSHLLPSCEYEYRITHEFKNGSILRDTEVKTFKTFPSKEMKPNKLTFMFGSCLLRSWYPFSVMTPLCNIKHDHNIELGLIVGDLIYSDIDAWFPLWRVPFVQSYMQILTGLCYQYFMQNTPTFVMFDDHEFEDDFTGKSKQPQMYSEAIQYWNIFAGNRNPPSIKNGEHYYSFNYGDLASFFVMDTRSHRAKNKTILGMEQKNHLKDWILNDNSKFKFIASPGSWSTDGDEYHPYNQELNELLDTIQSNTKKNIVIISGDMHFGAAYRYRGEIYEFSASPIHSIPLFNPTLEYPKDQERLFFNQFSQHYGIVTIDDDVKTVTFDILNFSTFYRIIGYDPKVIYSKTLKYN